MNILNFERRRPNNNSAALVDSALFVVVQMRAQLDALEAMLREYLDDLRSAENGEDTER